MKKLILTCSLLLFLGVAFTQEPGINVLVDNVDYADDYLIADTDGDGDNDLLTRTLNSLSGNRAFLENLGNGQFARPAYFTHHDENLQPALGDFDGDGDLDLAAGLTVGPATGFFYRNDGANTFSPPNLPDDLIFDLKGMLATDLDGDGDTDLLGWRFNRVFWAENLDGQGAFSGAIELDGGLPEIIRRMAVADVNQDGKPDLVCAIADADTELKLLVVYQNSLSDWTFDENQTTPTGLDDVNSQIAVLRLDGDAFPDIVLLGYRADGNIGPYFKVFANPAGASLFQEVYASEEAYDFAVGDIDGDGDNDLALQFRQSAGWLRNEGDFNWQEFAIPDTDILAAWLQLADMDEDGRLDLVQTRGILDRNNGAFFVPNAGGGNNWGARQTIHHEITRTNGFAACDWDADGDQDVVWTDPGSRQLYWLENTDGMGAFATNTALLALPGGGQRVYPRDLGQDGTADLLITIANDDTNSSFLLAILERTSNAPFGFGPLAIIDTLQKDQLNVGDLDGDGDADILGYHHLEGLSWWEQTPGGYALHPLANGDVNTLSATQPGIADLDGDGFPDVMGYVNRELTWFLNPDGQGPSAQQAAAPPYPSFIRANAVDINGDGRSEMVGPYFDQPSQTTYLTILRYQPANNTFGPLEYTHPLSTGNHSILDVNQDGFPDYASLDGTLLNLDGQGTFAPPIAPEIDLSIATTGDLNGDGTADLLASRFGLYWLESTPFLRPALTGRLALSQGDSCAYDAAAAGIPNWLARIEKEGGDTTYVSTNTDGRFALSLPDTGAYRVAVVPPFSYWETCPADTTLLFPEASSRDSAFFSANATTECPFVTVSVYAGPLRPCIPGFITISYVNNGTAVANDVTIEVLMDDRLLITGSNYPWDMMTDSSLLFTIPQLGLFESGRIVLNVEPDCNLVDAGDLICTTAQTEPDTSCLPPSPLWDGSTLEATGFCQGDTTYFELRNIGQGAMSEARQYRVEIVNDDLIVFLLDELQLNPGESLPILVPNDTSALRLVAQQDPNHPVAEDISLVIGGCSFPDSLVAGIVEQYPYSTGNPFRQTFCREVTSSFDPNAKSARPRGIGDEHLIEADWALNYTIDFQNTGNDTAVTVVIRDTLSPRLDLSSLQILGSSHDFSWQLRPGGELVFTFDKILLPDSTTNFEGSMGHVDFRIRPRAGLLPGMQIDNRAAIYFDFNEPIITNTVLHTIRKPQVYEVVQATLCPEDIYLGQYWTVDTTVVELTAFAEYDSLTTHHIQALTGQVSVVDTVLAAGSVLAGVVISQDTAFIDTIIIVDGCNAYITYRVDVISSSREAVQEIPGLAAYPNPASGQVTVDWRASLLQPQFLELYDAQGRRIARYTIAGSAKRKTIGLEPLPPGIYLLAIAGDFGRAYRRLAVQ